MYSYYLCTCQTCIESSKILLKTPRVYGKILLKTPCVYSKNIDEVMEITKHPRSCRLQIAVMMQMRKPEGPIRHPTQERTWGEEADYPGKEEAQSSSVPCR